jgi:lysophospholipase L1-like esterase
VLIRLDSIPVNVCRRNILGRSLLYLCAVACGGCSTPVTPTPPPATLAISCPVAPAAQSLDGKPVIVTYPAPVTTGGEGQVATTCTPPTGSSFAVGSTPVTCTARDSRQHTASCTFVASVTQVPRLRATRFLAFGDSITAGVIATTCPFNGPPTGLALLADTAQLRADLDASPGLSYPDVLNRQLSLRYAAQSFTMMNEGLPNERAVEGAVRLPGVLSSSLPEVVMLLEGVNDLNNGGSTAIPGVISALRTMIRDSRQRGATVMVSTILPERQGACRAYDYLDGVDDISAANVQIRALVNSEGAVLVDLHPLFVPQLTTWIGLDGLHPNESGYAAMAQAFSNVIRTRFEPPSPGAAVLVSTMSQ